MFLSGSSIPVEVIEASTGGSVRPPLTCDLLEADDAETCNFYDYMSFFLFAPLKTQTEPLKEGRDERRWGMNPEESNVQNPDGNRELRDVTEVVDSTNAGRRFVKMRLCASEGSAVKV